MIFNQLAKYLLHGKMYSSTNEPLLWLFQNNVFRIVGLQIVYIVLIYLYSNLNSLILTLYKQ